MAVSKTFYDAWARARAERRADEAAAAARWAVRQRTRSGDLYKLPHSVHAEEAEAEAEASRMAGLNPGSTFAVVPYDARREAPPPRRRR